MKNFAVRLQALLISALLLAAPSLPARAQSFPDTSTFAPASSVGGTANAITIGIDNWTQNFAGVPVRFMPLFDNTASTQVNVGGVGLVNLLKPANSGLAALNGGELRAGQIAQITFDGTQWVLADQLGQFVSSSTLSGSALGFDAPANLQIAASVAANQLTISLKTGSSGASPADATASTPIVIPYRDVAIANGFPVVQRVTGALSLTIASGSTMGCVSAQMCRLWVVAINNGGATALCAYNATSSNSSVLGLSEQALQSSASGTTGGNSAQTLYCSTSLVASKAIRYLGYVDISETTAGTWSTGPTYIQLFGPGIKKPGERVNLVRVPFTGLVIDTTPVPIPLDDTIPQVTEGLQYMTQTYTPQAAANVLRVHTKMVFATGAGVQALTSALFRDGGANALAATPQALPAGNNMAVVEIDWSGFAASVSSTTFTMRAAPGISSTTTMNGNTGARVFGGVSNSFIEIEEVMG